MMQRSEACVCVQAVVKAMFAPDSDHEEDAGALVPAAVQCICACLELASHRGCIIDLLASLPDEARDTSIALQVRIAIKIRHIMQKASCLAQ
jgi:hypothetical protein